MHLLDQLISKIYQESKTPYPPTPQRAKAQEEFISELAKIANGSERILDFCYGDALTIRLLRKFMPQARIVGVSGSQDEVVAAREIFSQDKEIYLPDACEMHECLNNNYCVGNKYNIILARHTIEHSVMPLVVLHYLNSLLYDGGVLAAVVPKDHQRFITYLNHYSVLSKDLWEYLFKLSGFEILKSWEGTFQANPDSIEWRYFLKKKNAGMLA